MVCRARRAPPPSDGSGLTRVEPARGLHRPQPRGNVIRNVTVYCPRFTRPAACAAPARVPHRISAGASTSTAPSPKTAAPPRGARCERHHMLDTSRDTGNVSWPGYPDIVSGRWLLLGSPVSSEPPRAWSVVLRLGACSQLPGSSPLDPSRRVARPAPVRGSAASSHTRSQPDRRPTRLPSTSCTRWIHRRRSSRVGNGSRLRVCRQPRPRSEPSSSERPRRRRSDFADQDRDSGAVFLRASLGQSSCGFRKIFIVPKRGEAESRRLRLARAA